jgi:hypothetical protein
MKFIIIAIVKKSIPVGISLPKDLISKIDEERGEIPRSRYLFRRLQTIFMNENKQFFNTGRKRFSDSLDSGCEPAIKRSASTYE